MKKGIKEVLQTEMLDFTAPLLINNIPSIDGLLVSQRQVIFAMDKANMNSKGKFYKMLKATGHIFSFYVLGDMPLCGVMKNMGNNYILNKYLIPKGSFGNKNMREGEGASSRYIETKLDQYSEEMLDGIKKDSVDMKFNYDATEKEPVILPSKIPNILTNLRMSISVSEANKMPSHNLIDVCDSIISYIDTKDIDKSIDIIKVPDLPSSGAIIYDKKTFDNIYKSGKGGFINIGKCKYDEAKRILTIYEIPYCTYIENIYDEIESNFDKFEQEVEDFHNGTDRNGLGLELYLKKNANVDVVVQKLRKYTSYESKFACNFTILDLDGKSPILCGLEKIINKWLSHRNTCIRRELQYDCNKYSQKLHLLNGLSKILEDLDKAIMIVRESNDDNDSINKLMLEYDIDKSQAEYISCIKLLNLNKGFINNKLKDIEELNNKIGKINLTLSSDDNINNIIKEQLKDVKNKFGKPRMSEIIYDDKKVIVPKEDLIEDYNCRVLLTNTFIKKHLKQSDNHKLSDDDNILCDITSNNKDSILVFTNLGNRYRIECNKLKTMTPSSFGQPIKDLFNLEQGEKVIKIVSISELKGHMLFIFENGKISKINIDKYMSKNTFLKNCFNMESNIVDLEYITKDVNVLLLSQEGKALIIDTKDINAKASRNSIGVSAIKLQEGFNLCNAIINIKGDECINVETEKGKKKEFNLDSESPNGEANLYEYFKGNKNSKGKFLINTRKNNDKVIKLSII